MEGCVFCKIVKKEIPSKIVFEDSDTIAFKDINPVSEGHVLVIPKEHYESIKDIPPKLLQECIITAQKVAEQMEREYGVNSVNILNCSGKDSGQSVGHFHLHVILRREGDGDSVIPKIDNLLRRK